MEAFVLDQIIADWNKQIYRVLHLEELSLPKLQGLLNETYEVLYSYHREALVPKEITAILLGMEQFLCYASMMEENEKGSGYYYWEEMHSVISALKRGFLSGEYDCAYPQLKITDCVDNAFLFDLEHDRMDGFIVAFRLTKSQPN